MLRFINNSLKAVMVMAMMVLSSCQEKQEESTSEEAETAVEQRTLEDIHLADPTIFLHDGTYYLYGTSQGNLSDKGQGFLVFTSDDLEHWEGPKGATDGFALKQGEAFGTKGFWAPQVFEHKDKFYMAYTANENIAIATSDNPLGPFTNPTREPLEAPVKQIDPYVFIADDGAKYLYHVRLTEGNRIFVAEMKDDFMGIKPETLKPVLSAEENWENTQNEEWPVSEGPTVLKKDSLYYLLYSANDFRNPDYAVGYAVSENPMGPWEKRTQNPIIEKEDVGINGPGHGDVFVGKEGQMHYVLHTHFSDEAVHPRKTAIIEMDFSESEGEDFELTVDEETFRFLEQEVQ